MVWVTFLISTLCIVAAAYFLAKYGDDLAERTNLGGLFFGTLFIATISSLPEFITSISSIVIKVPNLAVGNLLGSSMFNMVILAIIDVAHHQKRILRKSALKHALSGSLAIFLCGLAVFFIAANINLKVGWVGFDSLVLIGVYIGGIYLLRKNEIHIHSAREEKKKIAFPPGTWKPLLWFLAATVVLIVATPVMVGSSKTIAEITGLGTTFIGTTLVAIVTSLPELITSIFAVRLGAVDMAIGNLFGSNMFNIFALGLADIFFIQGRLLAFADPSFLIVGLLGLLMTGMGLIGNLARLERRIFFIEIDSLLIIITYLAGLYLLFVRGMVF